MTGRIRILVVDDNEDTLKVIADNLSAEGYIVDTFTSPKLALKQLERENYASVLVDFQMPEMTGLEFLEEAKGVDKDVPVVLFTAVATSVSQVVDAMKNGAYNYLTKPLNYDELLVVLKNSVTLCLLRKNYEKMQHELQKVYGTFNFVVKSKVMRKVFSQMEMASKTDSPVLIQGGAGTGKQTIAKIIHYNSARKDAPFLSLDCRAYPETFLESELFGARSAGTPEEKRSEAGKIEAADGGTLFLDGVEFLPSALQVKLSYFLDDKDYRRVAGGEEKKSDLPVRLHERVRSQSGGAQTGARIIAATMQDLKQSVEEKKFHEELFYCLNAFPIIVPSLKERKEDIPLLAEFFLKMYSKKYQKNIQCFTSDVYAKFLSYEFPGNVRELEHFIERACMTCQSSCIDVYDISEFLPDENQEGQGETPSPFLKGKNKVIENFEREYLISLLTATKGKIGEATQISGLAERNIHEKLKKYGIRKEDFKPEKKPLRQERGE